MDEFKDNLNKERKVEHHDIAQQMLQNVRGNFALDEATGLNIFVSTSTEK